MRPWVPLIITAVCLAFAAKLLIFPQLWWFSSEKKLKWESAQAQCAARFTLPEPLVTEERQVNERIAIYNSTTSKLILNARILDGDGSLSAELQDIYISNGLIEHIAPHSKHNQLLLTDVENIDARGHIVSPGLVEMHSHVGICSQPELKGVNDMFELMSPATPFTRVIDAFNIGDPAIQLNAMGGVTSSLVLPSANIISGEGYALKLVVPPSRSVEEMLVQYSPDTVSPNIGKRRRWMKMACGENPKKRYVNRPEAPKSRMGLGYLFRSYMDRATLLKDEQDEWCSQVEKNQIPTSPFPHEVELEILVGLLRGQVSSNAHCYETFDIETILRHAKEFNFEVNALHHALDAYMIPDMLSSLPWNITIATFATLWGFKKEANQASLFSPQILDSNGLNVVLTTDHPALPGHTLVYQAQIAHNYGLPADVAFASITGNPASALGLDDRIGYLREGYDADLVIWDYHPLQPGSKPLKVLIDGEKVLDMDIPGGVAEVDAPESRYDAETMGQTEEGVPVSDYLIKGIKTSYLKSLSKSSEEEHEMLVIDGQVACFAASCPSPKSIKTITLNSGYIIPGITTISEAHGMVDIDSEHSTGDGDIRDGLASLDASKILYAKDGLHLGSEHIIRALNSGVTRFITPPFRSEGQRFITGVSTAFKSNSDDLDSAIIKEAVALHVTFGEAGKEAGMPTVSSQISTLRRLLEDNKDADNAYGQVARGDLPLAAHVNSKDIIAHLLKLKSSLGFKLVIIGGLEAHLLADKLVAAEVPVLVKQWRCQRKYWDERRCLTGVGGEQTVLANLTASGVTVGLGYTEDQDIRLALDNLAAATRASEMSAVDAIDMVAKNVLEMFGLAFVETDSIVVLEGSPLEFGTKVAAVIDDGVLIKESPIPEPAFDPLR